MILVIGGRSKIGTAVIRGLRDKGEPVRALTRAPETGAFPGGVEPPTGDLADIASLARAMNDVDRVFLLCGPTRNEYWLNRNAIDAAEGADVRLLGPQLDPRRRSRVRLGDRRAGGLERRSHTLTALSRRPEQRSPGGEGDDVRGCRPTAHRLVLPRSTLSTMSALRTGDVASK